MTRTPFAFAALLLSGCEARSSPSYLYGIPLDEVEFNLYSLSMGIYPSLSVLDDPNNPFASNGVSTDVKWDVFDSGLWPAAFYAWATFLTQETWGEPQYYTGVCLQQMYDHNSVEDADLYYVRQLAIDAYQSVLDNFPLDETQDATGEFSFPLAPLAFEGIVALGAQPDGWIEVQTADGGTTVMEAP